MDLPVIPQHAPLPFAEHHPKDDPCTAKGRRGLPPPRPQPPPKFPGVIERPHPEMGQRATQPGMKATGPGKHLARGEACQDKEERELERASPERHRITSATTRESREGKRRC